MKEKLMKVTPDGFDAAALLKAAREGRLYVKEPEKPLGQQIDDCRKEALAYVAAISECATDVFQEKISSIWQQLLKEQAITHGLVISKGKNRGQMNRYLITTIVEIMYENGVYDKQRFKFVELHLRMEHTRTRTNIYINKANYWPERSVIKRIKEIIKETAKIGTV